MWKAFEILTYKHWPFFYKFERCVAIRERSQIMSEAKETNGGLVNATKKNSDKGAQLFPTAGTVWTSPSIRQNFCNLNKIIQFKITFSIYKDLSSLTPMTNFKVVN